MVKFGRLIECEHQLCYAHGIHLAVCDVLYQKSTTSVAVPLSEEIQTEDEERNDDIEKDEEDFSYSIDFESVLCERLAEDPFDIDISFELHDTLGNEIVCSQIINKVRKIAKFFRKSPLKNNILQKYVEQEHGKNLHLFLDSKTRWNSLLAMLERFIKIRSSISKAIIDCNKDTDNFDLDKQEVTVIRDIVASLQPLKAGAEKLGNRGSTLLSSEGIFSFIINELNQLNTPFSRRLKESFIRRIAERRNVKLTGLIQYLNSGKNYGKVSTFPSEKSLPALPTKTMLILSAKQMLDRLFEVSTDSTSGDTDQLPDVASSSAMTLAEKLDAAIKEAEIDRSRKVDNKSSTETRLENEIEIFEATGEKTHNICLLLNALKTIPPTSIESERAFSAAGLFITKLRTRLSDRSIDHLCFLKSHYKNLQ
ncbi:uncharacterized protein LOC111641584 [Centruroides sculpturatus]|uniref:uncharacterized protein LOC111630573 n=1 Tax=Centruroides sculpturatus TaxID=218467 RepID=UPI000C6E04CD|nr:uncharacterized protein LOC111630573 [Centruroides sculpturatus]XP_023243531.1 uncharacterized protein LOC111641584 [Centruroides sculpturatus]